MQTEKNNPQQSRWTQLLREAVTNPGLILEAYSNFHDYSLGNQILAILQCRVRGIQPGAIRTYHGWQELGRQVKRGERALELCMPLKRKREVESGEAEHFTLFMFKRAWFVLAQTEGEPLALPALPDWEATRALATLQIEQVEFRSLNGNSQGYATGRSIAINPVAQLPHKTLFHELAHVVLGHTAELAMQDDDTTLRDLREVEAESVALLCCESLGLSGANYARGYIQEWLRGDVIPDTSARKIFAAADSILKAGRPAQLDFVSA